MHVMFYECFKKHNISVSSHDFRHTKITELVNAGMPLTEVQSYVGHSSAQTTLSYVERKKTSDIIKGMVDANL